MSKSFLFSLSFVAVAAFAVACAPSETASASSESQSATTARSDQAEKGNSPLVGKKAPDFTLMSAEGGSVKLSEAVKDGPVVLVFYRGHWCPFCQRQLADYKKAESQFKDAGAKVYAVSVEGKDDLIKMRDRHKMAGPTFGFLSDPEFVVGKQYGGVTEDGKLHVPAVYVIGEDQTVTYGFSEVDYKVRAAFPNVLKAVQGS